MSVEIKNSDGKVYNFKNMRQAFEFVEEHADEFLFYQFKKTDGSSSVATKIRRI